MRIEQIMNANTLNQYYAGVKGTSFVEFVSTCNAGWKMSPAEANTWMEKNMIPVYPIGDLKDK